MSQRKVVLVWCYFTIFTASDCIAQQLTEIYSPDSVAEHEFDRSFHRLLAGADGEIYGVGNVVVRLTGKNPPEEIIRLTGADVTYGTPRPSDVPRIIEVYGMPYVGSLAFASIGDIETFANGVIYASVPGADMVVSIDTDGNIEVVLDASHPSLTGDFVFGSPLDQPEELVTDSEKNLYITNLRSHNVVKLSHQGDVTQILNSDIAGTEVLRPSELAVDSADNIYVTALTKLFKISPDGEVTLLLDASVSLSEYVTSNTSIEHQLIDKYGNVYIGLDNRHSDLLFRLTPLGRLEVVFSETGDGTGVSVSKYTDDHVIGGVDFYGNFLAERTRLQLDAAQNVYLAGTIGNHTWQVFRLGLTGSIDVVAKFQLGNQQVLNTSIEPVLDSFGNYYLATTNQTVFKLAPVPIEPDYGIIENPLESDELQNKHWINWITKFSSTNYAATSNLYENLAQLDTSREPLSDLMWADATIATTSSSLESDGSVSETYTSQLWDNDAHYTAKLHTSLPLNSSTAVVKRIEFERNGEIVFSASNLAFPISIYSSLAGEDLMRWMYSRNDVIYGSPGNDVIFGYSGHDIIYGQDGDDMLHGGSGGSILSGGNGYDTAVFDYNQGDYAISRHPSSGWISVQAKIGYSSPFPDSVNFDVEQLQFADSIIDTSELNYWGDAQILRVQPKEAINSPEVYRFFNSRDNAFFFTTSIEERDLIIRYSYGDNELDAYWPYVFQGAQFKPANSYPGSVPLYRFYNYSTGHHFFTANESESDYILEQINQGNWPFNYEGAAFNVYPNDPTPHSQGEETPVHRFYSTSLNRHFFTSNPIEVDALQSSEIWSYEGIGFYAEKL